MTAERWRQVREILYAASAMDSAARGPYVDAACGADTSLREEVERLLGALSQSGTFLEPAAVPAQPALDDTRIGHYRILAEAGRGGMGVVYHAVRDNDYRQEVAVKLVKRDMETDVLIARFRQERQALALLNHPNIARLLDGGSTPDGRPYLVMEWVAGKPITDYCEQNRLGLRARLELFLAVCDAVAHAHRNLVVHRDLKPSNILITAEGRPKLLDFGIAKIFSPEPGDQMSTMTMAGTLALTPDYASPEQVRGEPVTTATDIYSLGAVLFEILTARRPHRLETRTPGEIERVVCSQEVARPSAVAGASGVAAQELRGDPDNIVLKALEKDPARRYADVAELAADVRRYLDGRPVLARPDSMWYRVSKFTRRNKLLVGCAAAVVLALAAGLIVALWQARVARQERAVAERRFDLARHLAGTLLFEVHDEIADLAGASKARELVLQRSIEYLDALAKEAGSAPALERDLANAYQRIAALQGAAGVSNLGHPEDARRILQKALALRESVLASDPSSVDYRRELAQAHREFAGINMNAAEKLTHAQTALSLVEGVLRQKPNDPLLLSEQAASEYAVAHALTEQSHFPEAVAYYRRVLAHSSSSSAQSVALYHKRLGALLIKTGDLAGALAEYQLAVALDEARVRENPANGRAKMDLSFGYSDWGWILRKTGRFREALDQYGKAEKIRAELAAADPRDARAATGLVSVHWRMALVQADAGNRASSQEAFRKAIQEAEALERRFPDKSVGKDAVASACFQFGACLKDKWSDCAHARVWLARARELYGEIEDAQGVKDCDAELAGCR